MVNKCFVSGCKSESYPGCGKSFHRFPADDETRQKWIQALNINRNLYKSCVVCSLHFKDEDFITQAKKRLSPHAIPTLTPKIFPYPNRIAVSSPIEMLETEEYDIKSEHSEDHETNVMYDNGVRTIEFIGPGLSEMKSEDSYGSEPSVKIYPDPYRVSVPSSMEMIETEEYDINSEHSEDSENDVRTMEFIDPCLSGKKFKDSYESEPSVKVHKDVGTQTQTFYGMSRETLQKNIKTLRVKLKRRDVKIKKLESTVKLLRKIINDLP